MALHTLNRPPGDTTCVTRCLDAIADGDALILIEDGVYVALPGHQALFSALPGNVSLNVLSVDLDARGISDKIQSVFNRVDDAGFVELACLHDKVISWF
ncbi:MAG: sulfurtransferase complex subunit TusB [Pontibacterium sp.]